MLLALTAVGDPPPNVGGVTPPPTAPPAADAGTSDKSDAPATVANSQPRRLWIVLDFYKEFGGTIVREDDATIVLRTPEGNQRTVDRNSIVAATQLLDDPVGTPVTVLFRDGRTMKGELVRDDFDVAVVTLAGVQTRIPRSTMLRLELQVSFDHRLAAIREKLQPGTAAQRLVIARWALNEGRPDIAIEELRAAQRLEDSEELQALLKQAMLKEDLRRGSPGTKKTKPSTGTPGKAKSNDDARESAPQLLISDDDVNRIRVMEVNFTRPPRMSASQDLWKQVQEKYADNPALPADPAARRAMQTWTASQMLQLLFTLKARDLYGEIRVSEDPEQLDLYRRKVHDAWIMPNCATSQCHGASGVGGLHLVTSHGRSPRAAYTNLITLLGAKTADGIALIDFDAPALSPLLDMARPRDQAKRPHPDVPGWKPTLSNSRGDLPSVAEAWIRGMHRPRSDYGVKVPQPAAPLEAPEHGGERE